MRILLAQLSVYHVYTEVQGSQKRESNSQELELTVHVEIEPRSSGRTVFLTTDLFLHTQETLLL